MIPQLRHVTEGIDIIPSIRNKKLLEVFSVKETEEKISRYLGWGFSRNLGVGGVKTPSNDILSHPITFMYTYRMRSLWNCTDSTKRVELYKEILFEIFNWIRVKHTMNKRSENHVKYYRWRYFYIRSYSSVIIFENVIIIIIPSKNSLQIDSRANKK